MDTRSMAEKFATATIEDLMADPTAYGAPTFEEFVKDPDKWREKPDQLLEVTSKGSSMFKEIAKHIYYIDGYRCKNEEEVERVAKDQGLKISDFTINVFTRTNGGGKKEAVIEFVRKK